MTSASEGEHSIRRQAIDWLLAQSSGAWSEEEAHSLQQWLEASPAHRLEFERAKAFLQQVDQFKSRDFPQRQTARRYHPTSRASRRGLRVALAMAASLVIAVVAWRELKSIEAPYRTDKGEQMTVALDDGSSIRLNTDTELRVRRLFGQRSVLLLKGQALFSVAHDPDRPFEVRTGGTRIRDIGTLFDVAADDRRTAVTVFEGAVEIATGRYKTPLRVAPEQTVTVSSDGHWSPPMRADTAAVSAWQRGKLIFRDLPLPTVLAELRRYHDIDVRFEGSDFDDIRISGTFSASDLKLFLKTLEAGFPIKAELVEPGRLVIRHKPSPALS